MAILLWVIVQAIRVFRRQDTTLSATGYRFLATSLIFVVTVGGYQLFYGLQGNPDRRVVLLGLDGVDWKVLNKIRSTGRLPAFDSLVEEGTIGYLRTLEPTLSPLIWTSIATGRTPEHHGIKDFWASSLQVKSKRIWEIADDRDIPSGVMGYLVTWPPRKKTGFLVPGWLAQGTETIPPQLSFLKELESAEKTGRQRSPLQIAQVAFQFLHHGASLSSLNKAAEITFSRRRRTIDARSVEIQSRLLRLRLFSEVFCHEMRRRKLAFGIFYDSAIDAIQHQFFKYFSPEFFEGLDSGELAEFRHAIPDAHAEADRAIGLLLECLGPDLELVVVSDHGAEPAFDEGGHWYHIKLGRVLETLGVDKQIRATNVGKGVFLRPIHDRAEFVDSLEPLRQVIVIDTGEPLFQLTVHENGDVLLSVNSEFDATATPEILVGDTQFDAGEILSDAERISGKHTLTSVLIMAGPSFAKSQQLEGGSVLDVTPTLLYLMGLPVSREMEGNVLMEAFSAEFRSGRTIEWIDSYGSVPLTEQSGQDQELDAETEEKLRALGYLQ